MGKKTLYHPVSVNVLRGALEFCGITPGRLRQLDSDRETGTATYEMRIEKMPASMARKSTRECAQAIQSCFASDVEVKAYGSEFFAEFDDQKIWVVFTTSCTPNDDVAEDAHPDAEVNNVR